MADQSATPDPVNGPTTPPRAPRAPREDLRSPRGRGRGQRGRGGSVGESAGRGRGRGRGHNRRLSETKPVDPTKPQLQAREIRRSSTHEPPNGLAQNEGQPATAIEEEEEDTEVEVCFICASPVIHNAIAPCNHRTCHICALRLRALYKTKACAHCRATAEYVVFTDDGGKRFEDFVEADFARKDLSLGIQYEKNDIYEDTVLLLRYNCPDSDCDMACYGWPDLHRHVRNVHHRILCDLCIRNKKVFTHEHTLFTHAELRKHERFGDDNPGAVDQSGFKGHPECGFCKQRFYGDDELYTHCRDKHERCHICDRSSNSRHQQYYLDYNELEKHFRTDHFLCPDTECLEQKFTVFESEMDLKAHQIEKHPNGLTKGRDSRRVDMRGFENYRGPQEQERGGRRREGRGRGRGRDPNSDEPLPVSTAQNLSRAEMAYQRQLAVQSAQSVSNRTFGGQLTSQDPVTARAPPRNEQPTSQTANVGGQSNGTRPTSSNNANPPTLDSLNLNDTPPAELSPADRARQVRHAAVVERASNLLGNDQSRLASFRSHVSSYRNGKMSPTELVDAFFALFDTDSTSLGTLVRELADIFEIQAKKNDLLKAWNDWRAINLDYPSLPGPDGDPAGGPSGSTGSGGKRILKLKSSTAQSSQSTVSQARSWGTANGTSTNGNPFPGLPGAGKPSQNKVPWVTNNSTSSPRASPAPQRQPAPAPVRPVQRSTAMSGVADAFPSLPPGQKLGMNVSRPGYAGTPTRKEGQGGSNTSVNAWGGGGVTSNLNAAIEAAAADDAGGGGKGKGKGKNKKVNLMHWG